ncbi:carbohydrate kinase family protein, partial [Phytoactinopolyspora endophytica]|uniref:carbohydrate kinase family protein n=1 Tax=Phytoactinopolyspora endophytica TaxID=1642495 RepID=UPI001F0D8CE3
RVGPAFIDWVRGVDILFANGAEAQALVGCRSGDAGRQAAELAGLVSGAAVVKLGADGALWSDGEQVVGQDTVAVPVVDATGAGDAFAAGFLESWTRAITDVEAALAAGCALGADAVGRVGAR